MSRYLEVVGGSPRVKWGALSSALVGTLALGQIWGLIDLIDTIGGGISWAISSLGTWIGDELVGGLFGIGAEATSAAWASNVAWIGGLGAFGIVVGALEVAFVSYVAIAGLQAVIRRLGGG